MKIHNPLVITGAIDTQASRIPATRSIGPEIKNLYPMKLAERIYLAQVKASIENLKSKIAQSIDCLRGASCEL
ncbi:hypothetical protein QUA81_06310 [Microcoleus sp. F6_B4]